MSDADDERMARGWATVRQINAPAAQQQWDDLVAIYPDFARYIVQSAYADVLSRPALPLREREIATLAALTTLGNAPGQLKAHIQGALNTGLTREEICEVLMQMAVYAGVPAAINAMKIAGEVFAEL
ncbi:MAG TPA: carboxymuconolactone decarboxylase family protein [Caulobacteraceae bacterium]|nr:carboxymuconolactone decarboxylase family protein [Caulobacteraceae bacterium]